MGGGNFEDLSLLGSICKRRVSLLDADVYVPADVTQAAVAHHRAGKQARFEQNLEAIADAQYHAAAAGEFFHRLHHRGESRNRAGAQVIAKREPARQDNRVAIREILGLVPDEFDGLFEDVADGVVRVLVAIGPGKNDDSKFRAGAAPWRNLGSVILAHTEARRSPRKGAITKDWERVPATVPERLGASRGRYMSTYIWHRCGVS